MPPEDIFLATFTEKAAHQLHDGLRALLGIYTNKTGRPFDLAKMSIGTVHGICQKMLEAFDESGAVFRHVIIDEYQDTNTIQEKLYFKLAETHRNLCVVGDDDQALYRFRGAAVENLVEFEQRCQDYLGRRPRRIDLDINYRSRQQIVGVYTDFIRREN